METSFTQQEAYSVMHMTRLLRELNSELREGNELLAERVKLLKLCAEGMREVQEETAWAAENLGGHHA